jgi:hypothetical protein
VVLEYLILYQVLLSIMPAVAAVEHTPLAEQMVRVVTVAAALAAAIMAREHQVLQTQAAAVEALEEALVVWVMVVLEVQVLLSLDTLAHNAALAV